MIGGVSDHYVVAGHGQPLVLLHGFPQNRAEWKPLAAEFGGEFKPIIPGLRGIGSGPGPATGHDKHSLATDIKAIIDMECGDKPVIICGHDMGAYMAFAFALKYRSQSIAAYLRILQ